MGDKASDRVLGVLVRLDVVDDDDVDEVVDANEWLDMDGEVDVDENDDERRYLLFIFSPLFASPPPFSGMSLEVGDDSLLSVDDVFSSYISAMQIFTPLVDAAAADDSAVSSTISRILLSGSSLDFSFIIVVDNDRFSTAISIFVIYISLIYSFIYVNSR